MNIICVGLSHKTAVLEVRERFAVPESGLSDTGRRFMEIEGVEEAAILSTCNRVEFYAAGREVVSGFAALDQFMLEHSGLRADHLEALYRLDFPHSVRHLYRVASGMDSMVLGETEILGQVKRAYKSASAEGLTSRVLNRLFQKAFSVAKHVRTKTRINRGSISVGSVAVDLAEKIFGRLNNCKVMIIGAGETGERTARSLISRGAKSIIVSNRSIERAEALAAEMGGKAIRFDNWESEFTGLDILIASTAAPHAVLTWEKLKPIMAARKDRPLFIIDIAVPRDVEPEVNQIENVYLYDIDSLREIADRSLESRKRELTACEEIIERHADEFDRWLRRVEFRSGGTDSATAERSVRISQT